VERKNGWTQLPRHPDLRPRLRSAAGAVSLWVGRVCGPGPAPNRPQRPASARPAGIPPRAGTPGGVRPCGMIPEVLLDSGMGCRYPAGIICGIHVPADPRHRPGNRSNMRMRPTKRRRRFASAGQ
jgi:hypothetical protein